MNRKLWLTNALALVSGILITAPLLLGVSLWKRKPPAETSPPMKVPVVLAVKPEIQHDDLVVALRGSSIDHQLQSAESLASMTAVQLQDTCEKLFTEGTKPADAALNAALICWVKVDGKAALTWAWDNYQGRRFWSVLRNTGPACAWYHPDIFADWLIAHATPVPGGEHLSKHHIERMLELLAKRSFQAAFKLDRSQRADALFPGKRTTVLIESTESVAELQQVRDVYGPTSKLVMEEFANRFPGARAGFTVQDPATHNLFERAYRQRWEALDQDGFAHAMANGELQPLEPKPVVDLTSFEQQPSAASADALLTNVEESLRPDTLREIVGTWTAKDPVAANHWLSQLDPGQETWGARQAYAEASITQDPIGAFNSLETIDNTAVRQELIHDLFESWDLQAKDEDILSSLENPEWSDSQRQVLIELYAARRWQP
ncbi:MAG: hypothetical protein ACI8T1_002603 [Verrucomicrobiales bacterium]|jgi:hypothetical protein